MRTGATLPSLTSIPTIPRISSREEGSTSIIADMAFDFGGETGGTLLTTTKLGNAKIGGTGWTMSYVLGGSHGGVALEQTTLETDGTSPSYSIPFSIGGSTYDADGDFVIVSDRTGRAGNDSAWEGWRATPSGGALAQSVTVAGFVKFDCDATAGQEALLDEVIMNNSANYIVMQMRASDVPTRSALVHSDGDGTGNVYGTTVVISNTQWYRFDLRFNLTDGQAELVLRNADTLAVVVASRNPTAAVEVNNIEFFKGYLSCWGGETRYKGLVLALDTNATMPLGDLTLTAPASVTATQTDASEVTLTWTGQAFDYKVERQKNGGAWTTLTSTEAASPYVDLDLVDTDVVTYRITSQVNAYSSSATESNTVTVDNSVTLLIDEGFEGSGAPSGWTNSPFGGVDYDSTSSPLVGLQSLVLGGIGDPAWTRVSFSGGTEVWGKLLFDITSTPPSNTLFLELMDGSDNVMLSVTWFTDGTLTVSDSSGFLFETTVAAIGGATNYLWIQYRAATGVGNNDGLCRVWHNTTDTKPANGSNNSAGGTNGRGVGSIAAIRLFIGANKGTWKFDEVQIADSAFE